MSYLNSLSGIASLPGKKAANNTPRWVTYLAPLLFGLTFLVALIQISWQEAMDEKKDEFLLESVSIKQMIAQNVFTSSDVIDNIASYIDSYTDANKNKFVSFTDGLLERHPYISSINYYRYTDDQGVPSLNLHFQNVREEKYATSTRYIYQQLKYREAIDTALSTMEVVLASSVVEGGPYWLFKAIAPVQPPGLMTPAINTTTISGILAMQISARKLLGYLDSYKRLSITILSSAGNLSGRQLLYANKDSLPAPSGIWKIKDLLEENIIQLPSYSIKLIFSQAIYFSDIDYHLIFVATLLGIGILLLLLALVRAKELQTKELKSRNQMIENKVKEQTRELAIARDKALEASRAKSDFLASISHEIRTPLNAISGMAELLSETRLTDEQRKYTDIFRKAGDTLLSLVNDVLDLSKIEAGQMMLEEIPFDIIKLIDETVDIYAVKAARKGIELVCAIAPELNRYRIGDPSRLRQIILNLIGNALKFTDTGEIVVTIQADTISDSGEHVYFSVRDTGIGTAPEKINTIFASFTQADSSTTRKYGGTGLGLTISKSLVELMQGTLQVESELGKGSTFFFSIPLRQQTPPENKKSLLDRTIYIIDEHADNTAVMLALLQAKGAICKLFNRDLEIPPEAGSADLVFIDSDFAFADGSDLLDRLLAIYQRSQLALIIGPLKLNRHAKFAARYRLENHLLKPIKRDELISLAEKLLITDNPQGTTSVADAEHSNKPVTGRHILLVEDNPENRLLIQAYLKATPHTVDEAENGEIAVDLFKNRRYDLVLMDVQMPIMDGRQATHIIRQWEQEQGRERTPIISLTAHAIKEEIDKCLASGCDSHLSKPIRKATLLQTIAALDD